MRLYLAGETSMTRETNWDREVEGWQVGRLSKVTKRRLYSYFFHGFNKHDRLSEEIQLAHESGIDLFLDSGAYSAFTQDRIIPVDRYAGFINRYGAIFGPIANMDDIGDDTGGSKSWANLKALESLGCPVFPVFHYDDDYRYLKKMVDNYGFIALGGLVGAHRSKLQPWLDYVWGNYLVKKDRTARLAVHGFGLTDIVLMKRYPWFSVDSSSWVMAGNFGGCVFHRKGKLQNVIFSEESNDRRHFDGWHYEQLSYSDPKKKQVDSWLLPHGVTAEQCSKHYSFRWLVNAGTYQDLEHIGIRTFNYHQEYLFDEAIQ